MTKDNHEEINPSLFPSPEANLTPYGAEQMFTLLPGSIKGIGGIACVVGDVSSGETDDNETRTEEDVISNGGPFEIYPALITVL